ncbi:MAG: hypothetical protein AAGA16_07595 [Cyanobacteria bacterium P01_E01_bin.35]
MNGVLDEALTLVIPTGMTRDMNKRDLTNLMTSYGIIEQAKSDFLAQLITFEEYIDLCNSHQINVDSYMETIEHNLVQLKVL